MKGIRQSGFIRNTATLTILSLLLGGCLMDDDVAEDNEVSGSVGDGPIIGASIRILRNDGTELMQLESDSTAGYNITVRTRGRYYPLSINARNGTDLVTNTTPDFDLLGAVLEPGKKSVANINPFSTFAVELAGELPGGADKTNLITAQSMVSSELNNGLTSLATSGAMNTKIDSSNVAEIVRASEALGETVRRTRDALLASGYSASGNDVVLALSSDLIDSVVDGLGGARSNARFAAVWNIVSAQVLLETMANELHVNGGDATQLMSDAIDVVSVGTANPALADLTVTAEMLERARVGLVAAHAITSDTSIANLLTDMDGIQAGSGSSTVRNSALPGDYRDRLNNALLLVAGGSDAVIESVNDVSRNRTQTIITGPVTGSVRLTWTAPTQNEDGTALTDLAGYKIYWGTTAGNYPNSVTINDATATTYVVDNLAPGAYEFVATSFNTSNVESSYSTPATKVVQ
jgi:hypothetical protein